MILADVIGDFIIKWSIPLAGLGVLMWAGEKFIRYIRSKDRDWNQSESIESGMAEFNDKMKVLTEEMEQLFEPLIEENAEIWKPENKDEAEKQKLLLSKKISEMARLYESEGL